MSAKERKRLKALDAVQKGTSRKPKRPRRRVVFHNNSVLPWDTDH